VGAKVKDPGGEGEGDVSYGSLFVFTQKKKGDFEWAHPTRIDFPQASRKIGSFCVLGGRDGAPARVVASSEQRIFLVTSGGGNYQVEKMDGGDLGSIEAVSCADFDGDGIDDLAVAVDGSLQVFRGASRLP